ncbi:MAG: hypothetical protein AAFO98_10560, partial [Pseudomonadota bacterium]
MFYDAGGASGVYNPGTDFQVEITTTYVVPNPYFTQSVTITPPASNSDPVKFYHALDTFLNINVPFGSNPDEGPAFTLEQSPGNLSVVGVARDADGDGAIDSFTAFAEVQGGEEFDQYYTAQYDGAGLYANGINDGGDIVNTVDTNPTTDNGLGIQFNLDQPNVAQTFEYHVAFRGEATIDLDGDDSSGAVGSGFNTTYEVGSGATVPIADSDVAIQNVVGDIDEVRITLTNPLAGDSLTVNAGALPANVGVQSQSATEIVLETTGGFALPEATFDLALQQLGFTTTSTFLANRTIDVAITNEIGEEGLASAGTIAFALPANEVPTSTGGTINGAEDVPYVFSASDFNFADADAGDALVSVRIDTLPTAGALVLGNTAVLANDIIPVASLPNLTFVPVLNQSGLGYDSFTYSVNDGTAFAAASATMTINIAPSNDAPIPVIDPAVEGDRFAYAGGTVETPLLVVSTNDRLDPPTLTVAQLLADLGITDIEDSAFGIGVTRAQEGTGVWQYQRTDIANHPWTDFEPNDPGNTSDGAIPLGEVLLLSSQTQIRFIADDGFTGLVELEYRVWDQTVGTASNPPSTLADDSGAGGVADISSLSADSILVAAMLIDNDTDGDGVIDAEDIDDDNDGILDALECASFDTATDPLNPSLYTTETDLSGSLPLNGLAPIDSNALTFDATLNGSAAWVGGVELTTGFGLSEIISVQPDNTDFQNGDTAVYSMSFNQ